MEARVLRLNRRVQGIKESQMELKLKMVSAEGTTGARNVEES
jgi:hypothetical protein